MWSRCLGEIVVSMRNWKSSLFRVLQFLSGKSSFEKKNSCWITYQNYLHDHNRNAQIGNDLLLWCQAFIDLFSLTLSRVKTKMSKKEIHYVFVIHFGFYPYTPMCVSTIYSVLTQVLLWKTQRHITPVGFKPTTFVILNHFSFEFVGVLSQNCLTKEGWVEDMGRDLV